MCTRYVRFGIRCNCGSEWSDQQARGVVPTVRLYMEAQNFPDVTSYNVVAELTGSQFPDQVCHAGLAPLTYGRLSS